MTSPKPTQPGTPHPAKPEIRDKRDAVRRQIIRSNLTRLRKTSMWGESLSRENSRIVSSGIDHSRQDLALPAFPGKYSAPPAADDPEVDRLYALPLQEFVSARNAVAKTRRKAGHRAAADHIKSLSKPTLSAWIVNQLVRSRLTMVETLVAALDRIRMAQVGALEGRTDLPSLAESKRDERDTMAALETAAAQILAERGQAASPAIVQRALRSLRAAAADPEARELLLAGRMSTDHVEPGFEGLAIAASPLPDRRPEPTPPASRDQAATTPALGTIDLEIKRTQRAAAAKREEEAMARAREEQRRAREAERMTVSKQIDQIRRSIESTREVENRLTRRQHEAARAHAEAQRRMEDAIRVLHEADERLGETTQQRTQLEAELGELTARRDALLRDA